MSQVLHYPKISSAREAISQIYSTVERHLVVGISRENDAPVAVIRKDDLKQALQTLYPISPQVRFDTKKQTSMWIDGIPVSSQGEDFDSAGHALIGALRDYANMWVEDLKDYQNHRERWPLVNLVLLSDDDELFAFLFGRD